MSLFSHVLSDIVISRLGKTKPILSIVACKLIDYHRFIFFIVLISSF